MKPRALVAWSSGKDSAWTLHELRRAGEVEVVGLMTTLGERSGRVPMHAVPAELVRAQAAAARLPLWEVALPEPCPNSEYEAVMRALSERARSERIDAIAFGDLFLADIREYRESRLAGTGVRPLFPLWMRPTAELARQMLDSGLSATVTSVDLGKLGREHCGRCFDAELIAALPVAVDPCGENGEFHTFVSAGPMLVGSIPIALGAVTENEGFAHIELRASGS